MRLICRGKVLLLNIRAAVAVDRAERFAERIVQIEGEPVRQAMLNGGLQRVVIRLAYVAVNIRDGTVLREGTQRLRDVSYESGERQRHTWHYRGGGGDVCRSRIQGEQIAQHQIFRIHLI